MSNLYQLKPNPNSPAEIDIVVEVPKGSSNKYEYDPDLGIIRLDRVLYSPMYYPGDYGFMPGTLADDGDPLDAVVLMEQPTFPGVVVTVRPLGYLEMSDEKGVDEKLLCVPVHDPRYGGYTTLDDVEPHRLQEIVHFFRTYKDLENKVTQVGDWRDIDAAHELIRRCIANHERTVQGRDKAQAL